MEHENMIVICNNIDFDDIVGQAAKIFNAYYSTITLDFSFVDFMTSRHIGALMAIAEKAIKSGCHLFIKNFREDFIDQIHAMGYGNRLSSATIDMV